ncbi:MAG: protein translocase subunit SecF [Nitriliruptorales bacterium]|nr:protein translocase subunit SecF [Nitriliruptorales bacterium]
MKATPHFDFVGRRRTWIYVSGGLVLLSLLGLLIQGLNLSIDFEGGSSYLVEDVTRDITSQQVRDEVEAAGAQDVTAQIRVDEGEPTGVLVRTAAIEPGSETDQQVIAALADVTGTTQEQVEISFVGPTWGERISRKALEALVVFLIVVVIYISLRLEFKMAIAAVIALVHDVFITVGIYSLVGFTVSPATVIALLTILGYSLYDTVVVFDRVKENARGIGGAGRRTYGEMVNLSMNEVLWRSINTSLTSLLPVGALLFIGSQLLGAETLQDLALALFIGMALGAYSSLFVAGPFLAWWKEQEPEYERMKTKVQKRIEAGEEPEEQTVEDATAAKAPITTDYVRGPGRKKRKKR